MSCCRSASCFRRVPKEDSLSTTPLPCAFSWILPSAVSTDPLKWFSNLPSYFTKSDSTTTGTRKTEQRTQGPRPICVGLSRRSRQLGFVRQGKESKVAAPVLRGVIFGVVFYSSKEHRQIWTVSRSNATGLVYHLPGEERNTPPRDWHHGITDLSPQHPTRGPVQSRLLC